MRRLLLAFLLAIGVAPAFAQAPPAVPALPDTERRTTYSISSGTCACAVGFQIYGDNNDFQNWVEVWLNGIRVNSNDVTFGWTLTSPSGSLATLSRPITDAIITFTNAQTGTVQIVGARRPRRTTQFTEGRGVAARDLNQAFTDLTAQSRETWDKLNDVTGRSLLSQPGNTLGPLPLPSLCQNQVLGFDATGLNPVCVTGGGGGGAVATVSNSDGTLTISPTTGTVVGSINLAHANIWGAAQTFPANSLTLGEFPTIANNTVIGNVAGLTTGPTALSTAQLTTLCNSFTNSLGGCVPGSGGGTSNFLRADGTWAAPPGGGTGCTVTGVIEGYLFNNGASACSTSSGFTTGGPTGPDAEANTIKFTGAAASMTGNGQASLGASSTAGAVVVGEGSTSDLTLENKSGTSVCAVATGTTTLNCTGLQVGGTNVSTTAGTVTSIATNNGVTGGTITSSGTIGLATIATSNVLGNFGGSTAAPSAASVPTCANDGGHALTNSGGAGFNCTAISAASGGLVSVVTYTTSQTITIPTGATKAFIRMVGGGGGASGTSGGVPSDGGGAGYLEKTLTGLTAGNTLTLTIGAGGSTTGTNGTASTLASGTQTITTLTAGGGPGDNSQSGAAGGTATNGDVNITGGAGNSTLGGGMSHFSMLHGGGNATGFGGGGASLNSSTGGTGSNGLCIIMWFT